ncbi:MAG: IPT/TIG domain-containing protein [Cyclobacteriaceae bacterium]
MRLLATIVLGVSLIITFGDLHAQSNITDIEYFFDTDPGLGEGTTITIASGSIISLDDEVINTSVLEQGFHTLFVRGRNSNFVWGPYESRLVFIDRLSGLTDLVEISQVEYFIDTDPGLGSGTNIPVSATQQLFTADDVAIDTDGLSTGFHTLFVRGKSAVGWGPYESRLIYVDQSVGFGDVVNIAQAEYFFDTDPGFGSGTPITVGSVSELFSAVNETITTQELSVGFHTLFVRGKSEAGTWGPYESRMLYVDPTDPQSVRSIADIEYFIDTDPGLGNGTSLDLTYGETSYEEMIAVSTSGLDAGEHTLFLRAQDETGAWGTYETHDFTVYPEILSENFDSDVPVSNSNGTFTLTSGDWELTNTRLESSLTRNTSAGAARLTANNAAIASPVFSGTSDLTFYYRAAGSSDQFFSVQKSVNGGAFTTIQSLGATTNYQQFSTELNEGDASVRIKIETASSGNGDDLIIDDFTGAAITPVLAQRFYPGNNGTDVALDSTLAVVFDQAVLEGTGNFYVVRVSDSTAVQTIGSGNVTISSDSVYFTLSGVDYSTAYGLIIDPGAVKNSSQVDFAGIQNLQTWSFTTEDAPPASITITAPNGGEVWQVGSLQNITWEETSFDSEDNLVITYSTNGNDGPFDQAITSGVPTDFNGSYEWTIPDDVSTTVFVKVENTTQTVSDLSDAAFSIEAAIPNPSTLAENFNDGSGIPESNYSGQLTLTSGIYQAGSLTESSTGGVGASKAIILNRSSSFLELPPLDKPQAITFQYAKVSGFEGSVNVTKSINGGGFQYVGGIEANITDFAEFSVDLNETNDNVVIQIDHNGGDPVLIDEIVVGQLTPEPAVTLTAPNGGETWLVGAAQNITWDETSFDSEDNLVISYSTNGNDGPFTQITTGVPIDFDGSYEWTVPNDVSTTVIVKVENTTQTVSDLSNVSFTIVQGTTTNYALDLDGNLDYVELANPSSFNFGTGDFTMELWFNTRSLASTQVVLSDYNFTTAGSMGLALLSNGGISAFVGTNTFNVATAASKIGINQWYHLALVKQGDNGYIYIDGNLETTAAGLSTRTLNSIVNMNIGRQPSGSPFYFNGTIDEVRFWNDARTATEISDNKDIQLTGSEGGLIAYYNLNDGPGSTMAVDNAGNNDGTLTNMDENTDWVTSTAVSCSPEGKFLGTVDNDWNKPANWCGGVVPSPSNITQDIVVSGDLDISELGDFVLNGVEFIVEEGAELMIDLNSNILDLQNGAIFTNNGTITFGEGTQINDPSGDFINNGTIKGGGVFNDDFTNPLVGTMAPGFTPGCTSFEEDFTNVGTLAIEIEGITPCTEHDQITVVGTANLGGTLNVTVGYTPTDGDEIVFVDATTISGTFATLNLPTDWVIAYNSPNAGEVSLTYTAPAPPNFFVNFATGIPSNWTTGDAGWEDNPAFGYLGDQGVASIQNNAGAFLQTPLLTDLTEFSFYYRASSSSLADGAIFNVQSSTDGTNFEPISGDITKLDETFQLFEISPFGLPQDYYIRIFISNGGDRGLLVDNISSDGTATIVDNTAPVISAASADLIAPNLEGAATVDETGTIYYAVYSTFVGPGGPADADALKAAAPNGSSVLASGSTLVEDAGQPISFSATSVSPNFIFAGVNYNVYYVAEDQAGNLSTIEEFLNVTATAPAAITFNTPSADDVLYFGNSLDVDFTPTGIEDTDEVTFQLSIDGGSTYPYQLVSNPLSSFENGPDYFFDYTLDNPAFVSNQVTVRAQVSGETVGTSGQFSIEERSISDLSVVFLAPGELIYDKASTLSFTNNGYTSYDLFFLRPGLPPLQALDNAPIGGLEFVEFEATPALVAQNARIQVVAGSESLVSDYFDIVYPVKVQNGNSDPLSSLDFGVVDVNDDDPVLSYQLEVTDVAVTVSSTNTPNFKVATDPEGAFANSLNIPANPGVNTTTIFVKFSQDDNGGEILTGDIENTFVDSNTNPITQNVSVIGREATGSPLMILTSPQPNDEFVSNEVISISWTSNLVDLLSVEYTIDEGANWNLIANNLSDGITSFEWLVPDVATLTTASIRIVDQAEVDPALSQEAEFDILPAPAITSIALINSDTQLQIDGTGFSSNAGENEVVFPGFPDISTYPATATTTQLIVNVPEGAVSGFITVNVDNKGTAISPDQLVLDGISISPLQGQIGQTLFVNASGGVDFQTGSPTVNVIFDNAGTPVTATSVSVISAEVLSVVIPVGVVASDKVTVEVNASSYTSPQDFSVQSFEFSPTTAGMFQQVTITGVNTSFLNNNTRVYVNGVEATSKSVLTDTEISFSVPQGANTGRVSISTDNGFFESTGDLTVDFHKITSLSATKAGPGTQVTINGSNFNNIPSSGGVIVNGVTLTNSFGPFAVINYTRLDANTITFTVPNTAEGTGKVVVIQGGVEVESPEDFTIIPRITNVSPNQAAPGAQVTISGSYFSSTDNTVYFEDNVPAAIVSQNTSSITVTVPQNAADGPIRVLNNEAFEEGVSTSSFDAVPAPVFTSFAPLQASAGEVVTITGENLSNPNATSVRYNGQSLSFNVVNDNTITFTVPINIHGIGELELTKGALRVEGPALFTVVPKINSFTLATGAVVGASVTISGNGFNPTAGSNTVTFTGGATAEIINGNSTFLNITVPAGAQTGPISVTNNAINVTGTSTTNFIVVPAAEIAGFAPASGQISKTQVTITGQNFSTPNPTAVRFNGTAATFNVNSDTEITATVPGISANGLITIERAGGVSQSATNFAIAPDITGLSATTLASGASLILSGTYLSNADQVQIGTVNATITSNTNFNQIVVTVPAIAAGTYDVTIFKEGLQDIADQQLTVVPPHTIGSFPSVVDLGEQITITGTNMDAPQPSLVRLNGVTASIVSASSTELVLTVPTNMFNAGQGKVAITRAGLTITSDDDFFVRPSITTDFSTTNYVVDQQVTISGTNFQFPSVTAVTINGATALFSVSNDNSLSVTIPDAVGTGGSVVITSPAPIGTVTAVTTIDIVPRAILSSLDKVIEAVGQTITINGSNFTLPDVSAVAINGRSAAFTVESATEITATVPSNPLSTQGIVTITRAGLTETSSETFTMKQTISSVTPITVALGGTVNVSGTYFTNPTATVTLSSDPVTPNSTVNFGNFNFDVPLATSLGTNEIEFERVNNTDGLVSAGNIEVIAAHTITDTTVLGGWVARGESIVLTGTNFDNSPEVLVQGISAAITGNTGTEITFTVPSSITSSTRTITVRRAGLDVSQLDGQTTDLNFYLKPTINTGISVDPYVAGQLVTVSGSNLAGINDVTVNDISTPITSASDVSITFRLSNQSNVPLSPGMFDVKLINTSPADDLVLTLPQQITIDAQATVTQITEASAPVGGTINIVGDGFTNPDVTQVTLNGRAYNSFNILDDNNISLAIENGTGAFANSNNVVLTRAGLNITASDAFFVEHQIDAFRDENVQTFNPSTSRVVEGQLIYVDGNYFENGTEISDVTVNGISASFNFQNDDRIQITVPPASPGIGKVAITRRGLEVESAQALVISAPPTLSGIAPNARIAGSTISVQGANLALPDIETVMINGASASFSVINGGIITATVPSGADATGLITVTTNGVTSGGLPFNVVPRIFSFTNSGLEGSEITINGSHFGSTIGTNQVFFSSGTGINLSATVSSVTADVLTVTVPNGIITGPIRVVNTTSVQEATSSANFNLLASPDNFTLNPASGPVASTFTIEGDNLNGASGVTINGIPATSFDADPDGTSIQVTVPNAATTGEVVVTKSGVDFNTGQTFSVTPKVLSFPSVATVGSEIRINGKTLTGATAVTVNGNAAAIQSGSSEFVNVLLDASNVGIGNIEITTPSGVGTSTSTIEVKGAPAIAAFNPTIGTEGDLVTITGTDLSTVTFVRFNGITASFNINSDTEIAATVPNTETGKISIGLSGVETTSAEDFLYTKSENDPPAITSATATIADAAFNGNATADKAGTLYFVALTDGQAVPSISQIKDAAIGGLTLTGQTSFGTAILPTAFVGVDFNAAGSFTLGQLYDFHFMMDDTDNNTSDIFTLSDIEPVAELALTAPNGGENLVVGSTSNITWSSLNIPPTDEIDILVSTDNGTSFNSILTGAETFESLGGTFAWTVPNTLNATSLIRVRSITNNIEDVSDAVFSIVPVPVINVAGVTVTTGITIDDADAADLAATQAAYTVSGTGLLGSVNLAIQSTDVAGFEISSDGVNFGTTATVAAGTTGNIRVRATNTTNNGRSYNGTIVHTSTSALAINLPVEVNELLEAATLTITSPKPDTLVSGEGIIPLKWTSTNLADEPVAVSYRAVGANAFISPQSANSSTGEFDFSVQSLESGDYEIRVLTTQLTTNVGDTLTFGVDRTPPVVTVESVIARNGMPALTGTVDDASAKVEIQIEGLEPVYLATVNEDNTWMVAEEIITPPLADGLYNIIATATDTLGNAAMDETTLELTVSFNAIAAEAVNVSPFSFVARWHRALDVSGYELQVANDPEFTQPVESFENVALEDTFLLVDAAELYHKHTYFYRMRLAYTEDEFSEYSNVIQVILPESPELAADSLTLVSLYQVTDGPNWRNRAGWLQDNRFDWAGVTFDGRRITGINLADNRLFGDASTVNFASLTALTSLDLSDNDLTGLGDLGSSANLLVADVSGNKLDFGDFQAQSNPEIFNFADQQAPLEEEVAILAENDAYIFDRTIGGAGNTYQWYKGQDELVGFTSSVFADGAISFEDQGDYYVEVRNGQFGDIVFTTNSLKVFVSSLERDSLALVALYENNGGESWAGVTGWTVLPIAQWSNIEVSGNRVRRVDLGGVGVTGVIPTEFATMSSVTYINLSDNEVDGLPDFTVMENLDTLVLEDNSLEFDAILKNLEIDSFNFANQAKITVKVEERIREGLDFRLAIDVDGRDLSYQWYFNGEGIPGADSTVYNIIDIDFEQMGQYRCDIQNATVSAAVPGFALSTGDFEILAIADLGGTIKTLANQPLDEGKATLYRVRELGTPYDSITSVDVINGVYNFEGAILGDYLVRIRADLETYFPTYVEAASTWSLADTIRLRRDDKEQYDGFIFFQPPPLFPGPDNPNEIVGILEIDDDDFLSNGRTEARRRVRRAGVGCFRARSVNRGEDDVIFELLAYVETDENGQFSVPNLPDGFYRVNIEFPGIPMDPNSFIEFELGTGANIEAELLQLAALVKPTGIVVEKIETTAVLREYFQEFNIFPNPVKDVLNVTYESLNKVGLEWQVINLNGQQMMSGEVPSGFDQAFQLDITSLVDGIYLFNIIDPGIRNNNQITTVRFVVKK